MPKYGEKAKEKVGQAMHEMKEGNLKLAKSHKAVTSWASLSPPGL
jgi:hypothetical protein